MFPASHGELGDLTPNVDRGNTHSYPGDQPPHLGNFGRTLDQALADARVNAPGNHVIASESGYHNALNHTGGHKPVSEKAAGIYYPRLFLEYARRGVARTFAYELVDLLPDSTDTNEQRHLGLYRNDWTAKPAASALRNTITLLDSPSASARSSLGYTLGNTADPDGSGTAGAVRDRLLQKADGSWWLALWQDSTVWEAGAKDISNSSVIVDVNLDRVMDVTGYRPTQGTGSTGGLTGVSSFRAGVGDDVLLIKLTTP